MKRIFSCSSSQVAVEKWNRSDQKLLEAVQRGDVGRVASLASRKSARPTKLNSSGQSSFHLAASKGLTECLTILLANGADINSKNEDGSTALHLATISCQPQCVKVLLQHGANEDAVDAENRSPLHWAASSGCASSVLLLCDHEAFLNVPDNDGRTPLMIASLGGHAAICSQLLQRGAQVNVTDKDAKSALILACEKGSAEVAELLLSHGADAGAVDNEGHDALHYAVRSEDRELWRLLRQALLRQGRQGGQGLAQHPDLTSQASPSESLVGSPPQSPWRAEPEEEEEEDPCPDEWRRKYEEEQRKVSQLEQELVRKTEESEARAAACLGLENGIREQVQELGLLLSPQPGTPGGQGSSLRPGGDGMEQGCPLDLLAERIQELKKQQQAAAAAAAKRALASKKAEDLVLEVPYEAPGGAQPEEQGPPQSPRSETIGKATGQQLTTSGGQALGPDHTDKPRAGQKEGPRAPGAEPAGTAAAPVGPGDVNQLLLQLREELAAVWREKDAARGALSRPVLEGALGTPRAEAAAAAWEKMEARLEQVLVRLDRAKAGLPVSPDASARPREGALHTGPETTSEENEGGRPGAPGARGEPLGAPARGQVPGGGPAKGRLEKEVAALRLSNSNLLGELGQRLQGEPQSLSQRLQRDFVPKPEAQDQLRQLRRSVGLLTDELAAEKEATEQLRQRLASQSSGLRGLWDDLPPDVVGRGVAGLTAAEPLEELRACIRALADGHREAQASLARLEQENRRLRGSPGPRGEPPGTFSQGPVSPQVAALEQDLGKLEEELRAVQATMSGKSQEIGTLKKLLYQATEEVAELRAREAASLRQHEKTRGSLVAQAQAWGQELKALLEKYNTACREMGRLREAAAEERRRSGDLAARAAEQERQAAGLRGRSQQFEKTAEVLRDKVEHLIGACRDKEAKIKELLKKLEQLSEEVLAVRGENARLALQLQDSQKNHEEIISAYRKHLLNAAQGYMEQDVYNILLRILSIQEE
ncbi:ankyrin repeat domain-containing protein 35 isoform X2 [Leopardus geoffroyi]|uniref:ankyrin repeat domain-containing protein 35 isoform X2 n=1 Tax=Leopardus geoffroyi TaxID=46844 RepID=UPI001E26434C|nr:ankyrin repeat domain-containing protein 35 isoform X2 [Leopardus geoffroyi]